MQEEPEVTPEAPEEKPPVTPTVKPGLIITRTRYPKWWKELQTAAISLSTTGTQEVVPTRSGNNVFIATIVLVVSGETNIVMDFGVFGPTGVMNFGGENEPRGMLMAMGESPASCGEGGFSVSSTGENIVVGGFVSYYLEPV